MTMITFLETAPSGAIHICRIAEQYYVKPVRTIQAIKIDIMAAEGNNAKRSHLRAELTKALHAAMFGAYK